MALKKKNKRRRFKTVKEITASITKFMKGRPKNPNAEEDFEMLMKKAAKN